MYLLLNHLCWGVKNPKKQLCRKQPGCLVDTNRTRSSHAMCPSAKEGRQHTGLHKEGWQQVKRGDSSPLLTTGEVTSGGLHPVMGSPVKRKYRFTGLQRRWRAWSTGEMKKGLRELWLFSVGKRSLGGISSVRINIWREGAKRAEPGCSQWCPVTGNGHTLTHRRLSIWWNTYFL